EYSSGYWQDKVRQSAVEMCKEHKGRLLEVGCGEGLFLGQMITASPYVEVWGVDMWEKILSKARMRLQHIKPSAKLLKADASHLPFEDAFFDTVVCINVFFNMESIEKVSRALEEMARVCKRGGKIIFDFRNSRNLLLILKYRLAKYYDLTIKDLPLNTYNPGDIKTIVKGLKLNIVQEKHLSFPVKRFAPIIMLETVKQW
ncbi:MAG: class I SAM-dependent methyltransferase, partial [Thermodesulfovibrionia bacterium]|nr:class I SAM-dependent methyltransferase [Thermodesulfovibrionia bacterium]